MKVRHFLLALLTSAIVAPVAGAPGSVEAGLLLGHGHHRGLAVCADACNVCVPPPPPPVPVELCLVDPCTGCSYPVSLCLPPCCVAETPCIAWRNGIFGRRVAELTWSCCDHEARVIVTRHGHVKVREN